MMDSPAEMTDRIAEMADSPAEVTDKTTEMTDSHVKVHGPSRLYMQESPSMVNIKKV